MSASRSMTIIGTPPGDGQILLDHDLAALVVDATERAFRSGPALQRQHAALQIGQPLVVEALRRQQLDAGLPAQCGQQLGLRRSSLRSTSMAHTLEQKR